jgi:hypothetical protein
MRMDCAWRGNEKGRTGMRMTTVREGEWKGRTGMRMATVREGEWKGRTRNENDRTRNDNLPLTGLISSRDK